MKMLAMLAAGLAAATALSAVPAAAQPNHTRVVTTTTTTRVHRAGWNNHHARWRTVCNTSWRNHHRVRTCRRVHWG